MPPISSTLRLRSGPWETTVCPGAGSSFSPSIVIVTFSGCSGSPAIDPTSASNSPASKPSKKGTVFKLTLPLLLDVLTHRSREQLGGPRHPPKRPTSQPRCSFRGSPTGVARVDARRGHRLVFAQRPRACSWLAVCRSRRSRRLVLRWRVAPDAGGPLAGQQLISRGEPRTSPCSPTAGLSQLASSRLDLELVLRSVPLPPAERRARHVVRRRRLGRHEPGSFEFPHAVVVQPDGGIVVAGEGDCRYAMCFVLARYRPDGSLDPGFGEGGIALNLVRAVPRVARVFDVASHARRAASWLPDRADGRRRTGTARTSRSPATYRGREPRQELLAATGRATVDFGYGNDLAYAATSQARRPGCGGGPGYAQPLPD